MKKTTVFLGLLMFFCSLVAADAPSVINLTLDKALEMSLTQSPDVIKAQGSLDAAKNNIRVVSANDNPTLGLQLTATPWSNTNGSATNNSNYSNSISASYPLFTGFENQSNIAAAQASYNSAVYALSDAIRLAQVKTASYYLDCLNAIGDLEANRENVRNLQAHDEFVRAQYAVGKVSKLTLLQSVNTLSQAKLDLIKAENALSNATTALKIQIGVLDTVQIKLDDVKKVIQTPVKDVALANYQTTRPDVRAAVTTLQGDDYRLKSANSGWWPSINLNASAATNDSNVVFVNNSKYSWSVYGTLNYALSDGGSTTAAVKSAQIQIENDKKLLEIKKAHALADIKQSYDNLRDAAQALEVAKAGLAYAQEGYEIAKESFELGKSDNLTFFDSQKKLLDAKTSYNKAYYATITASYGVLSAIGSEK